MLELNDLVVLKIEPPLIVHSEKGRKFQMINRRCHGLSLCISGQITYEMNGRSFVSTPDTAILLPQGATYTLHGDKEGCFPVINFCCDGLICNEITVIHLKDPSACLHDFYTLKDLAVSEKNRFRFFSVFYKLLDEVFTQHTDANRFVSAAVAYMESHIADAAVDNDTIAQALKISEVYLRKLFKKHLHTTPKQYMLDLRIQKAKQLLTDSPYTVTATAEECGFSSVYHFSRKFKEMVGVSPSRYAEKHRVFKI